MLHSSSCCERSGPVKEDVFPASTAVNTEVGWSEALNMLHVKVAEPDGVDGIAEPVGVGDALPVPYSPTEDVDDVVVEVAC